VFDAFSIFVSVCFWFLRMVWVPRVQRVSFKSKFNVFVGCHWGCSYEVGI
jgi:hypothetical protein